MFGEVALINVQNMRLYSHFVEKIEFVEIFFVNVYSHID